MNKIKAKESQCYRGSSRSEKGIVQSYPMMLYWSRTGIPGCLQNVSKREALYNKVVPPFSLLHDSSLLRESSALQTF